MSGSLSRAERESTGQLLARLGIPASPEEVAVLARIFAEQTDGVRAMYEIDAAPDAAPAVTFSATPPPDPNHPAVR